MKEPTAMEPNHHSWTKKQNNNTNVNTVIDDTLIMKFAPNVVEGVEKLSNWAKKL